MKKLCLIIVLFLFVTFTIALQAQKRNVELIGIVDFNALLLLHPSMSDYVPSEKAFKVSLNQVQASQAKQRKQEISAQIVALRSQNKATEARIIELRRQYDRDLDVLADTYNKRTTGKLATETLAFETQNYNLKKDMREQKFKNEITMVNKILAGGLDRLSMLENYISKEGFTDYDETCKRFTLIINEIKKIISSIADKRGMSAVLNSSSDRIAKKALLQEGSIFNNEFSYKNVLFAKYLPPHEQGSHFDNSMANFYTHIVDSAKAWLINEGNLMSEFSNVLPQGSVIIGGSDITAEVLLSIFKEHKIDENISKSIANIFMTQIGK